MCKGFFAYNFSNELNRFGQPLGLTKDRLEEHSPAHSAPKFNERGAGECIVSVDGCKRSKMYWPPQGPSETKSSQEIDLCSIKQAKTTCEHLKIVKYRKMKTFS